MTKRKKIKEKKWPIHLRDKWSGYTCLYCSIYDLKEDYAIPYVMMGLKDVDDHFKSFRHPRDHYAMEILNQHYCEEKLNCTRGIVHLLV